MPERGKRWQGRAAANCDFYLEDRCRFAVFSFDYFVEDAACLERMSQINEKTVQIQKITPFLWFDHQAEEAATLYTSIFPNSKIVKVVRPGEAGPGRPGSAMTVEFQLQGLSFVALNGGPHFKFTEAISFVVNCQTQEELDVYWDNLSVGGAEGQCGWLKDKFGLSWQIVPTVLAELLNDPDPEKSGRVMKAMLQMKKLDIRALKQA
jgi:predicted 3-demethylubiquinone-9 3-methyltransferase (glyoxalase superfamily)